MSRSIASMNWSTMGTTSRGLAPSSCESLSRLKFTRMLHTYSRYSGRNSDWITPESSANSEVAALPGRQSTQVVEHRDYTLRDSQRRSAPVKNDVLSPAPSMAIICQGISNRRTDPVPAVTHEA
jgi:hypothetical protein